MIDSKLEKLMVKIQRKILLKKHQFLKLKNRNKKKPNHPKF